MDEAFTTRTVNGPARWLGSAALISLGFLMLHGIGILLLAAGILWAAFLGIRRAPGVGWAIGLVVLVGAGLIAAWEIF